MKKFFLEEVNSTNTYAKENIDFLEDKTIIYTNKQTAGRGRFTRKWVDLGSNNLYMTIVLKPSEKFEHVYQNLTQYLSLKNCKILETYGVKPQIKWPNDNLVNNKKISGILSEAVYSGSKLKGIVLGIGVNLNAEEYAVRAIPDRIATALNLETNQIINRDEFLNKLVYEFFKDYDKFLLEGFQSIQKDYLNYSVLIGENIIVQYLNRKIEGVFDTVNPDGTLKIITVQGIENLSIGDIV